MTIDQLKEAEKITGEQMFTIPADYPYKPEKMDQVEFDQMKKNPALFLRMYDNARKFVTAWEKGEPVPLNIENIPGKENKT